MLHQELPDPGATTKISDEPLKEFGDAKAAALNAGGLPNKALGLSGERAVEI